MMTAAKLASSHPSFRALGAIVLDCDQNALLDLADIQVGTRFAVSRSIEGEILLTPLTAIPAREHIIWEDDAVRESLLRGLAQAAAGELHDLGDFSQVSLGGSAF